MRRPRFVARGPIHLLAVALILIGVAAAAMALSSPAGAQAKGKLVLAWHAGFASRWLDPQEHDGTATPDNFFTALHDALIKNQGTQLYDHPALAERFAVAADSQERHVHAAQGHQVPQRRPGHPARRQVELRELPGRQGRRLQEEDRARRDRGRPHDPLRLQGALPRLRHPLRDRQRRRPRLGGAREVLQAGGRGRLQAEAHRRGPLQARPPRAGREGRDGGLRRRTTARST